jgi:hypothetical protein
MKPEVRELLRSQAKSRRAKLAGFSSAQRVALLEELISDFFGSQRAALLKWAILTGQSAQVDTGYIAQHMASVVLGEPGQGFKGKGLDLVDGTEVKSASIVSGVDRPRWNHNMNTIEQDEARRAKGQKPASDAYLTAPSIFYVLFDRVVSDEVDPDGLTILRVRAWCVDSRHDEAWRAAVEAFLDSRKSNPKRYNFQLHPPVGYDDDIVVSEIAGNLDLADVKVMEARFEVPKDLSERIAITWVRPPPDQVRPISGRTKALPYERRESRLEGAAGHDFDELFDVDTMFSGLGVAPSEDPARS